MSRLRVVIEDEWIRGTVAVYVAMVNGTDVRVLELLPGVELGADAPSAAGSALRWRPVEPGERGEPTLRLDPEILDAIVDERAQIRPADTTASAALDDARKVRDRLLTIVEAVSATDLENDLRQHVTKGSR